MDKRVMIVPYSLDWPCRFDAELVRLRGALSAPGIQIEHIGSTAVPGLAAKPIVDVAIALPAPLRPPDMVGALFSLGYAHRGEYGLPGREFFTLGEPATVHVHVVASDSPHWTAWLRFREALRGDVELRDRYEVLKRDLAVRHAGNRPAYTAAKTDFIRKAIATG